MLGRGPLRRARDRTAAATLRAIAPLFRDALADGVAPRACSRVGVSAESLQQWPATKLDR